MRIFARKHPYSRLRFDSRMDVEEKPEYPKISGGLQLMIALELIPYYTTVIMSTVLVTYILNHPELEWSDVFAWRCASFAGFSFMLLSQANYGDRVMNGRYYLFLMFLGFSVICMIFFFYAESEVALLVFACCIHPLLIIRDASRLCYIVQIMRATETSSKIRTVCFFLFFVSNFGAFVGAATFSSPDQNPQTKIWGCIGSIISYALLSSMVFVFGTSVVAHRNIVDRGFRCVVWKFENVVRGIIRKVCSCFQDKLKDKDYRSLYDEELINCVDCMLKMSATLCPLMVYFATVEMTFFTWVRDYDVLVDLGFQDWPISLLDVYHGFNVVNVVIIYVIIVPTVQCFINVRNVVIICLSFFTLCLSWMTTASMQYGNELRQTHYSIVNESKVIIFTSILDPVLLDINWSDKKWLHSGNFSTYYIRNTTTTDSPPSNVKIWQDKTQPGDSKKDITVAGYQSFLVNKNMTNCYLLIWDANHLLQKKPLTDLDKLFEPSTKVPDKLNGTLVILCSMNLYSSGPNAKKHYLVIRDMRTSKLQTELVCNSNKYDTVTNLSVGWYMLYLRQDEEFVPFQMQVNVKKGAVHYLYIKKGNNTFETYTGNFTNLVEPFFQIEREYILVQIGVFSFAYSMGMVALLAFMVGATPKHLLEFGFAIMYTARAFGSGVAAIFMGYVTPSSRGMFIWVVGMVAGLLVMVRNAWMYLSTARKCGPEVQRSESESSESEEELQNGQDEKTPQTPNGVKFNPTEQAHEPTPEPQPIPPTDNTAPTTKNQKTGWFSRRKDESPPPNKRPSTSTEPAPQETPVKNSAPVTGKKSKIQPEPSEKLDTLSSWFKKKPRPARNPSPAPDDQQPGSSSQTVIENDSSSKNKPEK